jgi:nucleotide-binding universal stress UspA family protein
LAGVIPEVVVPRSQYDDQREATAAGILRNVVADARSAGVEARSLNRCSSDPYRAIVETAKQEGCDLIVVGAFSAG